MENAKRKSLSRRHVFSLHSAKYIYYRWFGNVENVKYASYKGQCPKYNSYKFWTCVYHVLRVRNKLVYIIFHLRFGLPNFLFLAIFISLQNFCVVCSVFVNSVAKGIGGDKRSEAAVFVKTIHAGLLGHSQCLSQGSVGVK